jgi:uncharacterized membrane protein
MAGTMAGSVMSVQVRRISSADIDWALREGWADFREKRGDLVLLPFIYPLVGVLASAFAFNSQLFPLIFPLVAGLSILGPVVASGFYELARRRESGEDASWLHFLDPLTGANRVGIFALAGMLAVLFLAWLGAAWAIYTRTLGTLGPSSPGQFLSDLFATRQGWTMILVGNLVGALFAIVTLAVSAISFPMLVDKARGGAAVDPVEAVATSVAVFRENSGTMIRWGITVALLLALGSIPLFVGLMIVLPVLGYSTWHLYTRTITR